MAILTEWLKLMLAEVARKQDEAAREKAEQDARQPRKSSTSPVG